METQERARECRNEMARGEQVGTKVNGEGFQTYPWHVQTAGVKSLCHVHIAPRSRWREDPRFVDELGKIDLATTSPSALRSGRCGSWFPLPPAGIPTSSRVSSLSVCPRYLDSNSPSRIAPAQPAHWRPKRSPGQPPTVTRCSLRACRKSPSFRR